MPLSIQDINADLEFLRTYYSNTTTSNHQTYARWYSTSVHSQLQAMEERARREREELESIVLSPGLYKVGPLRFRGYGPRSNLFIIRSPFTLAMGNWHYVEFFHEWGELVPTLTPREMELMKGFLKAKINFSSAFVYEVEPVPDLREML